MNVVSDIALKAQGEIPGVELDRLVTQLDHYKAINQHLTATMH